MPDDPIKDTFGLEEFSRVTIVLQGLGRGEMLESSDEDLFDAVVDQLTLKARSVLRRFPSIAAKEDPEALVSEFYKKLQAVLSAADLKDRRHFFALACQHFRWMLLDLTRNRNENRNFENESVAEQLPTPGPGIETIVRGRQDVKTIFEFLDSHIKEVDREIFNLKVMLDMTFDDIAEQIEMPRSSVYERYRKTCEKLKTHLIDLEG